jgi:hypothetical protein
MARKPKIFVSGTVGDITFYEVDGKLRGRAYQKNVKQNKRTKRAAGCFGGGSSISKQLRIDLKPVLWDHNDKEFRYDMQKAISNWLRLGKMTKGADLDYIGSFEFNKLDYVHPNLKRKIKTDWSKKGKVSVTLPALNPLRDLGAPYTAEAIELKLMIAGCDVEERMSSGKALVKWEHAYEDTIVAENTVDLKIDLQPGSMYIIVLALKYKVKGLLLKDKKRLPVDVIGSYFIPAEGETVPDTPSPKADKRRKKVKSKK